MDRLKHIHPNALLIWQLRLILGAFFPAFLLFFFYRPEHILWKCAVGICAAVFLFFSLLWFPVKYWKLAYNIDGDTLYLRQGVIYTRYCSVTRKQLQYITLTSTPLQRCFSLYSAVLIMAGAHLFLPCIPLTEGEALCRWRAENSKEEAE